MERTSKAKERLGMIFMSNDGCKFFIKEYINALSVTVKFMDEHGAEVRTQWSRCKSGNVKNPYFKSVYGIGYLGEGDFLTNVKGKPTREYTLWKNMLKRCYSDKCHKIQPTYINCYVCERWLCFANFLEDLPLIEGYELWSNSEERISLDKDIKQAGVENKVYSLETCKFVTISENTRESDRRRWSAKNKSQNT